MTIESQSLAKGQWYLIYTKPRQETIAQINLEQQYYSVYLPKVEVKRRRLGIYTQVIEPMFPRYLFVNLQQGVDNWMPIRSTRGVASIVRFGGVPAAVPTPLVTLIQQNEQQHQHEKEVMQRFKKGDRVKILDPAWDHYQAIFQATTSKKRVSVLLELLGSKTEVEVPCHLVDRY